jgi:Protein of unknown function (DUF4235)
MADKPGDSRSRAIATIAALGAAFITRKVVTTAWTKITGKEPPENPEDPEVGWAEAMGWAAMMGVAVSIARLLATRLVHRQAHTPPPSPTPETADKAD